MQGRAGLERAYRRTTYRVDAPGGSIDLRIGEASPALDALLRSEGVDCWAFVTAWNPRSEKLSIKNNRLRNIALCGELRCAGLRWWPGQGVGDGGDWPPEDSLLVLGLNAVDALALGRRHGQHAVVTGRVGECAVLRWCDRGDPDTMTG